MVVSILLEHGADVRATDWVGRSGPVCCCCRGGHWDTLMLVLSAGGNPNEVDDAHHDLTPPIYYAVAKDSVRGVKALIDAGATDPSGASPHPVPPTPCTYVI